MPLEWYVGSEWKQPSMGLLKRVLNVEYSKMKRPAMISTCTIRITNVENLNGRETKYLATENANEEQIIEMDNSLTPIDCYVELLVQHMLVGETAGCSINTKTQTTPEEAIKFEMKLISIEQSRDFHTLTPKEVYEKALHMKAQGVTIFKKYPDLAHRYFARAAKILISLGPLAALTETEDGVNGSSPEELLKQLKCNLAACLLTKGRYEYVIYQTKFVEDESSDDCPEKAIYRRALAYFNLKEYESAQQLIEGRIKYYKDHKLFAELHRKIVHADKSSEAEYKAVVQRMFN